MTEGPSEARFGRAHSALRSHLGLGLLATQFVLAPMFLITPTTLPAIAGLAVHQALVVILLTGIATSARLRWACLGLVVASALVRALPAMAAAPQEATASLISAAGLGVLLAAATRRFFDGRAVTAALISNAVSIYLIAGVVWTLVYNACEVLAPGSIVRSDGGPVSSKDLHYFSYVTMTTLGYGDMVPTADAVRVLAVGQAIWGQVFLAVVLSRLVGLHVARETESSSDAGDGGAPERHR